MIKENSRGSEKERTNVVSSVRNEPCVAYPGKLTVEPVVPTDSGTVTAASLTALITSSPQQGKITAEFTLSSQEGKAADVMGTHSWQEDRLPAPGH